ncbi:hypothetical protein ACKX2D_04955 [Lachnospiraceae bacterium YH-ros2226]
MSASWEKIQSGSTTFTDHETSGDFANINSSVRIWANYIPGDRYITVTYQLDNVWFGSHPNIGSGFINSSLYIVPTKVPSTPLRTRWDYIPDTDNVNVAMADMNTWARQNGLSDGFLAVYQSDKDSGNVGTNGDWTDRRQHSYNIDISSISAGQSPTILVLTKRYYMWGPNAMNGHSYVLVGDARHLTAQDLGINPKIVNTNNSITL